LGDELAADAQHRRIADPEVEIGAAALQQEVEQRGDRGGGHSRSLRPNRPRLAGSAGGGGGCSTAASSRALSAWCSATSSASLPARTCSASESSSRSMP